MHGVIRATLPEESLDLIDREWPHDSPYWVRYDSPGEKKQALRDALPSVIFYALRWMNQFCPKNLEIDESWYGAGIHEIPIGGFLDPHLDCDRHPATGNRRARNAILFLDDFLPEWGGDLILYNPDLSGDGVKITPERGKIVWFDCDDEAYHGVPGPIVGPLPRRTLAVYWWEKMPAEWQASRPRAKFVAMANETPNEEKERWRNVRSVAVT